MEKLVIYTIGTLLLCSAAAYNGYPLVFFDSGAYLRAFIEFHNLPDRPIFYSIFVGLLHWRWSLWPIVFGQSLITVFVVERTLAHLVPRYSTGVAFGVLFALTVATSLPWFTGQIMPDFFTPLLVPTIYLVVLERDSLARLEYIVFLLILYIAEATHYTHIALTLGLLLFLSTVAVALRVMPLRNLLPVGVVTATAIISIYAVNYVERRELVFAPYSSIFLLDRLLAYGTAQEYLSDNCALKYYEICPYVDELKKLRGSGGFQWDQSGVLPRIGGPEHYRFEAQKLVRDIVLNAPIKHLWLVLGATAEQLFNFPTGRQFGSYGEGTQIYRMIATYFPGELGAYLSSKEYLGTLDLGFINAIDIPVAYCSLVAFAGLFVLAIAKRDVKLVTLMTIVLLSLLGNAFLCGALSSGDTRYQSRLMPLVSLVVIVGVCRIWSMKSSVLSQRYGDKVWRLFRGLSWRLQSR